jgi:hypothetical protein
MLRRAAWQAVPLLGHFSEVLTASINIDLMIAAVSTSETSINFYQITWRNIRKTVIFEKDTGSDL